MKKNVLLVCGAGISTSIIVRLLQDSDFAENFGFSCCDINSAPIKVLENDLVILAPHVKFMQHKLEKICNRYAIPLFVINASDYMSGDTRKLLNQCKSALKLEESIESKKIVFLYEKIGYLTQTLIHNQAFKSIAESRHWIIETYTIDDYIHSKDVDCLIVESQMSVYVPILFKNKQYKITRPILNCPASTYLDKSAQEMEKSILDALLKENHESLIQSR